jgi:hypothetical protein
MKSFSIWLAISVVGLLGIIGGITAIKGFVSPNEEPMGDSGSRFRNGISADSTSPIAGEVRGTTLTITGSEIFSGALTGTSVALSGSINYLESFERVSTAAGNLINTSTVAESGKTYYITTSTSQVLPLASTATGTVYRFVVAEALTVTSTISTSGYADIIEGTLIVAGAVVDCDAEDTILITAASENVGDFVELRSDGQKWFIGASGVLTATGWTCITS